MKDFQQSWFLLPEVTMKTLQWLWSSLVIDMW